LLGGLVLALGWQAAMRSVDFPVYHKAAVQVLHGDFEFYPHELYDGGVVPPSGFRYAPIVAFLFAPFGWLPLQPAAFVFFALKVALFVYVGRVMARAVGAGADAPALMLWSLLVVGGYLVEEFRDGNFHFVSVALMVVAYDSVERGHVARAAGALALAIAAKLTPIGLLAYFAIRRRVAASVATVGALVALLALPAVVVGVDTNSRLLTGFAKYAVLKVDEGDNFSLRGVLARYLGPDQRDDLTYPKTSVAELSNRALSGLWIGLLAVGGLGLLAVVWKEPADETGRLLEFSLVLTATILASPHSQTEHFVALYVPALALLGLLRVHPQLPERRAIQAGLVTCAAVSTVFPLLVGSRHRALVYEAASPFFFGTLALLVVLAFVTSRWKARADGLAAGRA
jgi:hypothetical protein